ncbi:MAG: amidohydrolase family protein, partial [Deltaproteobacteria bacterium]|nr:amidohydrolase family protein [Deltaproteobacteria bacterium]
MIIDAHTHMFHEKNLEEFKKMGGDWAQKKVAQLSGRLQSKPALCKVEDRLDMLERTSIDMQIVTPPHFIYSSHMPDEEADQLAVTRVINDGMARLMEESKGKLIGIGTVPLNEWDKYGQNEMERAINSLGLKGMAVASHYRGKPLDSPEFSGFWARSAEMDIPIHIHPADPAVFTGRPYEEGYDLAHTFGWPFETILTLSRLVFSETMDRFPNLKIISHHLGGALPFFWGRIEETYVTGRQDALIGKVMRKPLYDYFS